MADKFKFEPTPTQKMADKYDVVIIGSGGTGLTAALQAHELGLKPVVFEKMARLGGNTTRASSGMNAAETTVQLKHHVVDSMADFYHETLVGGGNQNNQQLLEFFTNHSALAIDWLAEHGVKLDDITITGGMSKMRTHRPSSMAPIGGFLITELLKLVQAAKIPVFTGVKVTDINTTDNVLSGVTLDIIGVKKELATTAVILATGGFGANKQMLAKYRPELAEYKTTNQPGAKGDGIELARSLGAKLVDMDQVQVHPTVQQDTDHTYLIGEAVRGEGAILVNNDGQRFVNELDTRKNVTAAIDSLGGTGAFLIFDQGIRDRVKAIEFYDHVGLVHHGTEITDLAKTINVPSKALETTIANWNMAVTEHNDQQFNRKTGMDRGVVTGPFYAIHIAPAVHYTMGGVAINTATEVLNEDNQPIAGLYAAGEVVGGLHGNNRIGGNSIAETVIFGRQAGIQVFAYVQSK
ncbi:fumarate reductase flavoprotein subunit [Weissella beninensis]|uniref:Flavocytochrome c n=1 Tax=Periweissella beninensis TaxID=504936 RepID=A0ABT0VIQ4_9LACO|nr:flavocytochrome c [Periweissella beninensis]MBM7543422.1 fumarate reductase flavoprotein subunit [Periweissella beninensis]MCM2437284.1 flavocytochrome c [Periweissella beninensis]